MWKASLNVGRGANEGSGVGDERPKISRSRCAVPALLLDDRIGLVPFQLNSPNRSIDVLAKLLRQYGSRK